MSSIGGASIGAGLYAIVSNPAQVGSAPEEAKGKHHHLKNGKGFQNPWDSHAELGFWELVAKGIFWRKVSGQSNKPDTTPPTVPVQTPNLHPSRETSKLRATWLGHACFYVEFPSGLRALFDPVFEDCCAPIQLSGLKRYTPPPCEIEDLPFVDVVVISHNHYDHLSYPTIQRIQKKFPEAHFFAPLGNKQWFLSSGVAKEKMTELDWWETRDVRLEKAQQTPETNGSVSVSSPDGSNVTGGISATIGALPCQHASARGPFDKFKTLWASWSIESGGAKVYFAGDTGYRTVPPNTPSAADLAADPTIDDYDEKFSHFPTCPAFSQIGTHRGPFDLGLIPIGAYEPRFLFSNVHANPKDAVNIFVDTKCRKALGMHWGTWVLTEEEVMEPPQKLREALKWKGVEESKFEVCDIGESREYETGL